MAIASFDFRRLCASSGRSRRGTAGEGGAVFMPNEPFNFLLWQVLHETGPATESYLLPIIPTINVYMHVKMYVYDCSV